MSFIPLDTNITPLNLPTDSPLPTHKQHHTFNSFHPPYHKMSSSTRRAFPTKKANPGANILQYNEETLAKDMARLSATLDADGYKGIKYDQDQFKKDCEAADIPWPPPGLAQSRWAKPAPPAPAHAAPVPPHTPTPGEDPPLAAPVKSTLSPLAAPFIPQQYLQEPATTSTPTAAKEPPLATQEPVPPKTPIPVQQHPVEPVAPIVTSREELATSCDEDFPTVSLPRDPASTPALRGLGQTRWAQTPTSPAAPSPRKAAVSKRAHGGLGQSSWATPASPATPNLSRTPAKPTPSTSQGPAAAGPSAHQAPDPTAKATREPAAVSAAPRGGLGGLAQSCWETKPVSSAPSSAPVTVSPPIPPTNSAASSAPKRPLGGLGQSRWANT